LFHSSIFPFFSFSEPAGRFQVCFGRYATTAARQVISDCSFQPQLVLFLYFKFMPVSNTMRCDFAYQVYVVLFSVNSDPTLFMHRIYIWTLCYTIALYQKASQSWLEQDSLYPHTLVDIFSLVKTVLCQLSNVPILI
jgi:hypothetical protein